MSEPSPLHYIRLAYGGQDDVFYKILHETIELLSSLNTSTENKIILGRNNPFYIDDYKKAFEHIEDLYNKVLSIWPVSRFLEIKDLLSRSSAYDEFIEVYRTSRFGIFLANTKSLTHLYESLQPSWNKCFDHWTEENAQLLKPYTGSSTFKTKLAIRQVINEVILHPNLYHEDFTAFKYLIKNHQKMLLA